MKDRNKKFTQVIIFTLITSLILPILSIKVAWSTLLLFGLIIFVTSAVSIYSISVYSQKIFKATFIVWVVFLIFELIYALLVYSGLIDIFSDSAYIQRLLDSTGGWAKIIFVLISFLQVTIVPIPSTVTVMAGSMLFGLWESVLLSLGGIILGSMFAFFLGKVFGVRLVKWIVGEEMLKKYQNITNGRDTVLLFFMFLLPMFPDDIICLIAGLTKMSYLKFFVMQILGRPLGTIAVAAIGGGNLNIPFSGLGILAWAGIGIAVFLAFYVLLKYSQPAMLWFRDFVTNRKRDKYGYGNINQAVINENIAGLVADTKIIRTVDVFYSQPKIIVQERRRTERKTIKTIVNSRKIKT